MQNGADQAGWELVWGVTSQTLVFRIDAICLECTGVHVITIVLFGVLVIGSASSAELAPD